VEVTAPRSRKPKPGIELHRSRSLESADRAVRDGIPVTSVARTLVDLAEVLDERRLASAVNEAEVLRLFDLIAIQVTLDRRPGGAGRRKLEQVLAAYREPPGYSTTRAERLFEELCERHGLPRPQRVAVAGYELDFYWADARLAVEVDGARFHRTRRAFHEDRSRDRRLAACGIQTARVTWRDLQAGAETAGELRAIRERRLTS
jgi:very-short-patch-repair endonuclease